MNTVIAASDTQSLSSADDIIRDINIGIAQANVQSDDTIRFARRYEEYPSVNHGQLLTSQLRLGTFGLIIVLTTEQLNMSQ